MNTIAHLLSSRVGKALYVPYFAVQAFRGKPLFKRINSESPYSEILRENRAIVGLAKLWWRRERVPTAPAGS